MAEDAREVSAALACAGHPGGEGPAEVVNREPLDTGFLEGGFPDTVVPVVRVDVILARGVRKDPKALPPTGVAPLQNLPHPVRHRYLSIAVRFRSGDRDPSAVLEAYVNPPKRKKLAAPNAGLDSNLHDLEVLGAHCLSEDLFFVSSHNARSLVLLG